MTAAAIVFQWLQWAQTPPAPFCVLDFDGPAKPPQRFGRLIFNRVGVYPGSLGNYSGLHKSIPVITIALPNAGSMPPDAEVRRIWRCLPAERAD